MKQKVKSYFYEVGVKADLKKSVVLLNKRLLFLSGSYRMPNKTSTVTFRTQCIARQKLLLPPSLRKLLIVWLGLDKLILLGLRKRKS